MFKGTYYHRIDGKGRLPIPAVFRRTLADGPHVVVTLLDQCLAIYTPLEWSRLENQLAVLPAFSQRVKGLTRLLMSRAADCDLDLQGRILLPPGLRQSVGLERDAVVVGVLNRIEVWRPDAWQRFLEDSERLLDDVSLDVQWPPPPAHASEPSTTPSKSPLRGARPQPKPNS